VEPHERHTPQLYLSTLKEGLNYIFRIHPRLRMEPYAEAGKKEYILMVTITVKIEDSKAALLRKKAEKYGLLLDQFITASIEDLITQPEPEFEAAMRKVLAKNKELYERLS